MAENEVDVSAGRIRGENDHLRMQLAEKDLEIGRLRNQLTAEQLARSSDLGKRRDREIALINELKMVQLGAKTGCVCPAGKCMHTITPGQLCWAQWAGTLAVRDAAQRMMDEIIRASTHPRRLSDQGTPG